MTDIDIDAVLDYLRALQLRICASLEDVDGKETFRHDSWDRPGGGGGESRVMVGGAVFEQAGVGFSHVFGDQMPPSATKNRPELAGKRFQAMGVSLVLHPRNPYVPTTHANFRFFTTNSDDGPPVWWYGVRSKPPPNHHTGGPSSLFVVKKRKFAWVVGTYGLRGCGFAH